MARRNRRNSRKTRVEPETVPSRFGAWLAVLVLLSFAVRLFHAYAVDAAPAGDLLLGDARSYHEWALRISSGDWLGDEVFYQAPLYPYFLGLLYRLLTPDPGVIRIAQAVLGSLACLFLALAGRRWFSPQVGLAAALMLGLYAPALFYAGLVQKTTLALFLFCLWLWLLSRTVDGGGSSKPWLAIGLCLSALVLTRENALILIAPLGAWLVLGPGDSPIAVRARNGLALVAGMAVLLLPVALRNHHLGGTLQLTTAQLGPNLYIGNNPDADGLYQPLRPGRDDPRFERLDAEAIAEERAGRRLSPAEVSSFYVGEVWSYVRARPLDWSALMVRKLRLVVNAAEVADTEDLSTHARSSGALALLGRAGHFGILLPLAALGGLWTWPSRGRIWVLYALTLVYAAGVALFFVFGRYRFPLVPLLVLLAAAGLCELVRSRSDIGRKKLAAAAALVLVFAAASNWPMVDDRVMQSVTRFNYGLGFHERGELALARSEYEEAARLQPALGEAHHRLGILDMQENRVESAILRFEEALRSLPSSAEVRNSLGHALLRRGKVDDAESQFRAALELRPDDAQTHNNLADAAFRKRDFERAESLYRRSLELAPANPQTHNNLGILSAVRGDRWGAIRHFRTALSLDPGYEEAQRNLERALGAT